MKNNAFAIDGIEQLSQNEMIELEGGAPFLLVAGLFFLGFGFGVWLFGR